MRHIDRFERFFSLSRDPLAVATADGRFVEVNDAWAHTLGWTREELVGKRYAAFVHRDDLQEARRSEFTARFRTPEGSWRWLEWMSQEHPDDDSVYVSARDVTERYEHFEAQRRSEERYRQLIENLPDSLITKTDSNLVVTFVGGGGLQLAGLHGEDYIGRTVNDIYAPYGNRCDELVALHRRALAGKTVETMLKSSLTDDDYKLRILPLFDHRGQIEGTMVIATNVTARLAAERQSRQLASLVATTAEAILSIDLQNQIKWINPRACELYGYSHRELVGMALTDLMAGDQDAFRRAINTANLAGEPFRGEIVNIDRFGRRFPVEITVAPHFDAHDSLVGRSVLVRDISERKASEARLSEANRRFEQALIHAPSGMAIVGLDGSWIEVNDALCRIVGYSHEELLTKTFVDITHPDDVDVDVAHIQELVLGQSDSYEMEKRYLRKDGSEIWILLTVSVVRDHTGRALHFISQILDIDERKRAELRLRAEAENDGLTGLVNRRRFMEVLGNAIALERHHHSTDALLFIDLDGFKAVNDVHGHAAGDELLCAVARALEHRLRTTDVVGRYGGDEFVVLLDNITEEAAHSVAAQLRDVIAQATDTVLGGQNVTASIGLAMLDGNEPATAQEAIELADAAMYRRKLARR